MLYIQLLIQCRPLQKKREILVNKFNIIEAGF